MLPYARRIDQHVASGVQELRGREESAFKYGVKHIAWTYAQSRYPHEVAATHVTDPVQHSGPLTVRAPAHVPIPPVLVKARTRTQGMQTDLKGVPQTRGTQTGETNPYLVVYHEHVLQRGRGW